MFETNATSKTRAFGVMKSKRKYHETVIKRRQDKEAREESIEETIHTEPSHSSQDTAEQGDIDVSLSAINIYCRMREIHSCFNFALGIESF